MTLLHFCSARAADDLFVQRLQTGVEEVRQGDLSAAMADLEAAVALDPKRFEGWYQLGLLRGQLADITGAEEDFRTAIRLRADFAPAHYSLGLSLTADPKTKLDWPGAIAEFREALKDKPDYAEALNMLGAGLTATGETEAAIPELKHAVALKPSFAGAHFNLAIALEDSGRREEASEEYELAISVRHGYPEASAALGKLLLSTGKAEGAEREVSKALRQNPDLEEAHYVRARTLRSLMRPDEAAIEFAEAKDLAQRQPDAVQSAVLSNRGLELAAKGDLAGAQDTLRQAIALKPDYGVPHYNLGLIFADAGNGGDAIQELTEAISLLPGNAKPWFNLGRVLKQKGDAKGALEALAWAARLSPSDPGIRREIASMELSSVSSGSSAPTETEVQATLQRPRVGAMSDTAADHIAFATKLRSQGDFMGQIGELLRALALQPGLAEARRDLANAYRQLNNDQRGILEYHKLLLILPDDVEARLSLGELLLSQGDAKQAGEEFRVVLARRPQSVEARRGLDRVTHPLTVH